MIIVEGPDGSGKSTFAAKLGGEIVHRNASTDKGRMFDAYCEAMINNPNAILDRAWYSEWVYGNAMRGYSELSLEDIAILESKMPEGSTIYYLSGSVTEMWRRANERGEDYVEGFEQYKEICRLYDELFNMKRRVKVVRIETC